jgi:pilus assembly protein Flp/PilA
MALITRFLKNDTGATAIEYAMIASLIALTIIGGATVIGTTLKTTFTTVGGAV